MNGDGPGKGAQFLATRIGQDALTIAELVEAGAAKDARIAELEAQLAAVGPTREKAKEQEDA